MGWAYEHLGLPPDANERDIKRAYARLLKQTRPGEDPEGFQRLRQAYETALAWAARREAAENDDADDTRAAPAMAPLEPERAPAPPEPDMDDSDGPPADFAPVPMPAPPEPAPVLLPVGQAAPVAPARVTGAGAGSGQAPEHGGTRVTMTPVEIARMLLAQVAALPTPEAVRQWLAEQPFLWELELKQAVADVLPWVLNDCEEPVFGDSLDALWAFFDLDQVTDGSHVDRTYAYQHKRHELSLRWLLLTGQQEPPTRPEQLQRLRAVWATGFMEDGRAAARLGRYLGWVQRPLALWQNVLRAVPWGQTEHMVGMLSWLSNGWQYALTPPLDGGQVRFWLRAHDHTAFSRERLAVVLAQYAVTLLVLLPPLVGLLALVHNGTHLDWVFLGTMAAWGLVVPLFRGLWMPLVHWQALPEADVVRHAGWHALCVPLILLAGVGMRELMDQPGTALVIWMWAGWLMYHRFQGRHGLAWSLGGAWWRWLALLFAVKAMFFVFALLLVAGHWVAVALLALWTWELYLARPLALSRRGEVA